MFLRDPLQHRILTTQEKAWIQGWMMGIPTSNRWCSDQLMQMMMAKRRVVVERKPALPIIQPPSPALVDTRGDAEIEDYCEVAHLDILTPGNTFSTPSSTAIVSSEYDHHILSPPPPLRESAVLTGGEVDEPQPPTRKRARRASSSTTHVAKSNQKRPRVPHDQCILITEATYDTLASMVLPRAKKIHSSANKKNLMEIDAIETELRSRGVLTDAWADRPPLPKKQKFKLRKDNKTPEELEELQKLENALKRKATDHYNKRRFAWNEAELFRLREYVRANAAN